MFLKKCCFCTFIPLGYRLLTLGYINLLMSVTGFLIFASYLLFFIPMGGEFVWDNSMLYIPYGLVDIFMGIILLIGAHKKIMSQLKVVFIYNILQLLVWTAIMIYQTVEHYNTPTEQFLDDYYNYNLIIAARISAFVFIAYLVIFLGSQIMELEDKRILSNTTDADYDNTSLDAVDTNLLIKDSPPSYSYKV